jgi:hypothetical protein
MLLRRLVMLAFSTSILHLERPVLCQHADAADSARTPCATENAEEHATKAVAAHDHIEIIDHELDNDGEPACEVPASGQVVATCSTPTAAVITAVFATPEVLDLPGDTNAMPRSRLTGPEPPPPKA